MTRTCSEICIDADNNSNDLGYLSDLWKEVVRNKYQYCVAELQFIKEHLIGYAQEMARMDLELLKL